MIKWWIHVIICMSKYIERTPGVNPLGDNNVLQVKMMCQYRSINVTKIHAGGMLI